MIKVVHFISSLQRGGRERQLITIFKNAQYIQDLRIIYLNDRKNSFLSELETINPKIIKIESQNIFKRLFELRQIITLEKPDIIYAWGTMEYSMVLILRPFVLKAKIINGTIRHGINLFKPIQIWRTILLHFSRNIVANSKAGLKANFLKRGKILYNGLDEVFFKNKNLSEEIIKLRENLNIPVLISIANFVPYKDYFTIFLALQKLKLENHSFSYLIIGDGPMKKTVEKWIQEFGLSKNIQLLGNRENVYEYLAVSDIFVHSSKGEGCSNAILEAMAAGLPVIATNTGGTSEIVKEEFGYLFPYKDYERLKILLEKMIVNSSLRKGMGALAKQYAEENFSISNMISKYHIIIEEIYNSK